MNNSLAVGANAGSAGFMASAKETDNLACLLDQAESLVKVLVKDECYSELPESVLGNMLDMLEEKIHAMKSNLLNIDSGMGVMQ